MSPITRDHFEMSRVLTPLELMDFIHWTNDHITTFGALPIEFAFEREYPKGSETEVVECELCHQQIIDLHEKLGYYELLRSMNPEYNGE